MSEQEKPKQIEKKEYVSQVLLMLETPENIKAGKIVFPKKNCLCRKCQFSDWQGKERDNELDDIDDNQEKNNEPVIITTRIIVVNYCHVRYKDTHDDEAGLPNIIACDGFYKQPKE